MADIVAWIGVEKDGYHARFIAAEVMGIRAPAERKFRTREEARQWIDDEAAAIAATILWWQE